jgi:hypothetical protein
MAPLILLLGFLVAAAGSKEGAAAGLVLLKQPAPVVLAGATCLIALLATYRLAGPPGFRPWWAKVPIALIGLYAAWALAVAIRARTPYPALIAGDGFWRSVPVALRGAAIGAFVLTPLAFVREFGLWMARLTLRGLLPWMCVFALGTWMAINAANL